MNTVAVYSQRKPDSLCIGPLSWFTSERNLPPWVLFGTMGHQWPEVGTCTHRAHLPTGRRKMIRWRVEEDSQGGLRCLDDAPVVLGYDFLPYSKFHKLTTIRCYIAAFRA